MMKQYVVDLLKQAGIHVFFANETQINEEDVKIELIIENRRSGKTTRKLLRAIADASGGSNVFFITVNHNMARDVYRRAREIALATKIDFFESANRIVIQGGGSIQFVSKERWNEDLVAGIRDVIEVWDI